MFMQLSDQSQNLSFRISLIKVFGIILLAILGVRLYYLQIKNSEYYEEKARNQQIRHLIIPAPRGAIFDRNGKILVDSSSNYNIIIANDALKNAENTDRIEKYAEGLGLDRDYISTRIAYLKKQPPFQSLILKENVSTQDIAWIESHELEYPELRIEIRPQRSYPLKTNLAHVLGYVGEVSAEQLKKAEYKGLSPGDIIGKGGLEQYYDQYLRGKDGYREVVVDSRGRIQNEIRTIPPQAGQDLYTTIDLDLQNTAENQLQNSITKRGVIIILDPNNGEILAMASAPSFDPNTFTNRSSSPQSRREISNYLNNEDRPLINRAIQGRYPPGSTWKIPESVAALRQGVITVNDSKIVCGGGIQIGNRFTKDTSGNHGVPDLPTAITKSCDGYYYRLALRMKLDGLIKMAEEFDFDKTTGIDLPNEKISHTPKFWAPSVIKREGKWSEIRTVFASIGQDTVQVTPISMIRVIAGIGLGGKMFTPHFLKEFKPISAIGEPEEKEYVSRREGFTYPLPEPKIIPMTDEQYKFVLKGMWGVVNNGGTAHRIKMPNLEIAGKTGTAQVAEIGKDVGKNKDHAWFDSFAPADKPEIAVLVLIENSGFGASNAAPPAKAIYEEYLQKKSADRSN